MGILALSHYPGYSGVDIDIFESDVSIKNVPCNKMPIAIRYNINATRVSDVH